MILIYWSTEEVAGAVPRQPPYAQAAHPSQTGLGLRNETIVLEYRGDGGIERAGALPGCGVSCRTAVGSFGRFDPCAADVP
ncbi:MAG TPA: hypothetical protein VJ323_14650, partial [Bryobacteraceae bacterium]|nr:hypothetical protein [Bryobacteraceae bacterium]